MEKPERQPKLRRLSVPVHGRGLSSNSSANTGTLLDRLADEWVHELQNKDGQILSGVPAEIRLASCCTGSGTDMHVAKALEKAIFGRLKRTIKFKHTWVAEIAKKKREWLLATWPNEDFCVFGDMVQMAPLRSHCYRHKRVCEVTAHDLICTGFS